MATIRVVIDPDLEDIVPGYLANRQKDVEEIQRCLECRDWGSLAVLGHRMKGSGAGYGFDEITEIGRRIEDAARDSDTGVIEEARVMLIDYLQAVEVVFGEA